MSGSNFSWESASIDWGYTAWRLLKGRLIAGFLAGSSRKNRFTMFVYAFPHSKQIYFYKEEDLRQYTCPEEAKCKLLTLAKLYGW